jgi:hypothetical protein
VRKIFKHVVKVMFASDDATGVPIPINQGATSCFAVLAGSSFAFPGPSPISHAYVLGAANEEDRARVAQILTGTAERFTLLDTYLTSGIPYTIRCFSESARGGCAVCARVVATDVMVDFFAGRESSPRFPAVVQHICRELRRAFGGRIQLQMQS